jgi:hypothetical protein
MDAALVCNGICTMKRSVLAIGLDPTIADLKAFPGLTPELIRSCIDAQMKKLSLSGSPQSAASSISVRPRRKWLLRF